METNGCLEKELVFAQINQQPNDLVTKAKSVNYYFQLKELERINDLQRKSDYCKGDF